MERPDARKIPRSGGTGSSPYRPGQGGLTAELRRRRRQTERRNLRRNRLVAVSVVALLPIAALVVELVGSDSGAMRGVTVRVGPDLQPVTSERLSRNARAAARYARSREGDVTFALSGSGFDLGYGAAETAPAASVIKVALMVAYLQDDDVRDRPLSAEEKSLLRAMITTSDNAAAAVVSEMVGDQAMAGLAASAGMTQFQYQDAWGLSRTSPADQVALMGQLNRLLPPRHRGLARGLLGGIVSRQRWGVWLEAPEGWQLLSKGGWGITDGTREGLVHHQVGRLERAGDSIEFALVTQDNPDDAYGRETLRGLGVRLFRGLDNRALGSRPTESGGS